MEETVIDYAIASVFPPKAWKLVLREDACYALFLGRDFRGFNRGRIRGAGDSNLERAISSAVVSGLAAASDRKIKKRLAELETKDAAAVAAGDKKCLVIAWSDLVAVKSKPKSIWTGEAWAQLAWKRGKKKFRFFTEEERARFCDWIKARRPDLTIS